MKKLFRNKSKRQNNIKGLIPNNIIDRMEMMINRLSHEISIFRKFSKFVADNEIVVTSKGIEEIDKLDGWEYKDEFFKIYDPINNSRILDMYNEKLVTYNLLLEKTLIG